MALLASRRDSRLTLLTSLVALVLPAVALGSQTAEPPPPICMVTTRPPKTIVKPTALGPVANTDTKLLICGLFQRGRVLAQDGIRFSLS